MAKSQIRRSNVIIMNKDLEDLETRVIDELGKKTFDDIGNYAFEFSCEEANVLGIPSIEPEFHELCLMRRAQIYTRLLTLYQVASDIPCQITIGLYDKKSVKKIVRDLYSTRRRKCQ